MFSDCSAHILCHQWYGYCQLEHRQRVSHAQPCNDRSDLDNFKSFSRLNSLNYFPIYIQCKFLPTKLIFMKIVFRKSNSTESSLVIIHCLRVRQKKSQHSLYSVKRLFSKGLAQWLLKVLPHLRPYFSFQNVSIDGIFTQVVGLRSSGWITKKK